MTAEWPRYWPAWPPCPGLSQSYARCALSPDKSPYGRGTSILVHAAALHGRRRLARESCAMLPASQVATVRAPPHARVHGSGWFHMQGETVSSSQGPPPLPQQVPQGKALTKEVDRLDRRNTPTLDQALMLGALPPMLAAPNATPKGVGSNTLQTFKRAPGAGAVLAWPPDSASFHRPTIARKVHDYWGTRGYRPPS